MIRAHDWLELDEHGLVRWVPNPPPAGPQTVANVLDPIVLSDPHRLTVVDDDGQLTYAELDAAANKVAEVLLDLGLRRGDRLAVRLPNSTEIVVLFIAAMRIGDR